MKRSLQLLIMIVSIIALNSCKDGITFSAYLFDNSKTTADNITENSAHLSCKVIKTEDGKQTPRTNVLFAVADYPEYFNGIIKSSSEHNYYYAYYVGDKSSNHSRLREGTFEIVFDGLKPNTTYYYAPYMDGAGVEVANCLMLGEVKSFTTSKHLYTKDEYSGTYTMTYRTDEKSGVQTWNKVKIGSTTTGEIYLQNLPPYGYTAYAYWGEKDGILLGTSEFYSEDDVSTYDGYNVAPIFTPIYYDVSKNEYYDALIDGYSYVNFVMTEKGVIKMIPTETAGSSGYYSNAFVWIVYRISTWKAIATSPVIYDVTLTKL